VQRVIKAVYDEFGFTWDPDEYHKDLWDIENYYVKRGGFWVAEHEGEVVGAIGLTTFPTLPGTPGEIVEVKGKQRVAGADCEFWRLYIVKEARGLKLGRALSETIMDAARAKGCRLMEIWSDKLFTDAHALYAKLGATTIGERICDDPDEAPEWGMMLPL
jgi:GNAT superfamily N-acetyltransferase